MINLYATNLKFTYMFYVWALFLQIELMDKMTSENEGFKFINKHICLYYDNDPRAFNQLFGYSIENWKRYLYD